jgi:hypothetical protein
MICRLCSTPEKIAVKTDSDEEDFMLVVRNCFIAKPGNASKLAAQLKEAAAVAKIPNHRVLTDLTGEFNRVILEFEVENVAGFEARLKDYATNEAFREKMKGYTDLWTTGSREILQIS